MVCSDVHLAWAKNVRHVVKQMTSVHITETEGMTLESSLSETKDSEHLQKIMTYSPSVIAFRGPQDATWTKEANSGRSQRLGTNSLQLTKIMAAGDTDWNHIGYSML